MISGHSSCLATRDACKLDAAECMCLLFIPGYGLRVVLFLYIFFPPTEKLYLFCTERLAFMFAIQICSLLTIL